MAIECKEKNRKYDNKLGLINMESRLRWKMEDEFVYENSCQKKIK